MLWNPLLKHMLVGEVCQGKTITLTGVHERVALLLLCPRLLAIPRDECRSAKGQELRGTSEDCHLRYSIYERASQWLRW